MKKFKAAIIQFDVHRGDLERNLGHVKRRAIALSQQGVKLIVLPEMWSVGFANRRLKELAGTTALVLKDLRRVARELRMTIAGSLPEKRGNKIYNTAYVVDNDGAIAGTYRKVHLFSPTGEDQYFVGGRKAVIAHTSLDPIGLMICYDVRFPELCRSLTLRGAPIVAVMAQWPAERRIHWDVLLRARATENQIFILGANRCGMDGPMVYGGHSRIISPDGQILARAGNRPASLHAEIDLRAVDRIRNRIPCLKERVPQAYK